MMVSTGNGEGAGSSLTPLVDCVATNSHVSLQISTSTKALLSDERSPRDFPDGGTSYSSKSRVLKSSGFRQVLEDKDEIPRSNPPQGLRKRFNSVLFRKIDWPFVTQMCKQWVRKPLNMALLLWIICVAVSGAILFLVMTGMLNHSLPKKSQRDEWFEINNQIINALFTLMCLYQHPKRFHHLFLLIRWDPDDITQLRKIYCKNGTYKPNEWKHMMVVVILLHINCFAQYGLCGLNLGYKRSQRPVIGVVVCLLVAIAAPAIAGLYSMISPLGKDYEYDGDEEEGANQIHRKSSEKRFSFTPREELGFVESRLEWKGGLFHLWEDFNVAYMSIFCCFCVFGWNMERLGFGNMYVHIATFLLFCIAPFLIFNLAAVNIDNDTVREVMGITGIALCLFGLLYGGFWRIKMRKRFNLAPNEMCFDKPDVGDCVQWLFCCWCSLAQEVRTGDYYDMVEEGRLFHRNNSNAPLAPLPREGSFGAESVSDLGPSFFIKGSVAMEGKMTPPTPTRMRIEVENAREIRK